MQINTLSAELGLWSEVVDWCRDATSVPCSNSLINLSPRTDDWICYCTNTGSVPRSYISRNSWSNQNFWTMNTQKLPLLSKCSNHFFPHMEKSFPAVLPKTVCQFPLRIYDKSSKRNLQSIKKHQLTKCHNEVRLFFLKRIIWNKKDTFWLPKKDYNSWKSFLLPVINPLF